MRFKHILFPVDFSENSRVLAKETEWLAARFQSHVTLLHVVDRPALPRGEDEAADARTDLLERSALANLSSLEISVPQANMQTILAHGDPSQQILARAERDACDLIIMAGNGPGHLGTLLLGSVTATVMQYSDCPVWTHSAAHLRNPGPARGVSRIVVGIQLDEETVPLLRFTANVARELGATVQVIHSMPEVAHIPRRYLDSEMNRNYIAPTRFEIERLQRLAGTEFPFSISGEPISKAISTSVQACNGDLVIVGRGKSQQLLGRFRTHVYQIMADVWCPVLSFSPERNAQGVQAKASAVDQTDVQLGLPEPR